MNDHINDHEFQFVRSWLRHYVGQDLADDKQYLVRVSLSEIVVKYNYRSLSRLIAHLEQCAPILSNCSLYSLKTSLTAVDANFVQDVIDAMMVNETYFFRRPSTFEDLRLKTLPELIEKRRRTRQLRICCLACSSGQEPYSLMMTIDQYFPDVMAHWDLLIVASDVSCKTLQRAEAAIYSDWETSRGLDPGLRSRYFHHEKQGWRIDEKMKQKIIFRQANLIDTIESLPYAPFDLILLRNVLLYFDMKAKSLILEKVRRLITDDGILLLGESETLLGLESQFKISNQIPAVCYPIIP